MSTAVAANGTNIRHRQRAMCRRSESMRGCFTLPLYSRCLAVVCADSDYHGGENGNTKKKTDTSGRPPKKSLNAVATLKRKGKVSGTKLQMAKSLGVSKTTFDKMLDELTAAGEAVFGKPSRGGYHLALAT